MADRKVISIDGMGGDNAPGIVVEGLERFARARPDFHFLLHGDEGPQVREERGAPTREDALARLLLLAQAVELERGFLDGFAADARLARGGEQVVVGEAV